MKKLTAIHRKTIAALISQPSVEKAAGLVGVSENTVYRWKRDPLFKKELQEQEKELYEDVLSYFRIGLKRAIAEIMRLMTGSFSDSVRLRAARTLLELNLRYKEQLLIEEKLDKLLEELEQLNAKP